MSDTELRDGYVKLIDDVYSRSYASVFSTLDKSKTPPASNDGWKYETREQEVDVYLKKEGDLYAVKGVGYISAPVDVVAFLFLTPGYRSLWDEIYLEGWAVTRLDPDTFALYGGFQAPWPVSNRDVISICRMTRIDEQTIFLSSVDAGEHPSIPNPRNKYVRGCLEYYGFQITQEGDTSKVVYSVHLDPKGSIPNWVINQTNIQKVQIINKVAKMLAVPGAIAAVQDTMARIQAYEDAVWKETKEKQLKYPEDEDYKQQKNRHVEHTPIPK